MAKYLRKDGSKKPAINNSGRRTRLDRSGKEPGQRKAEFMAKEGYVTDHQLRKEVFGQGRTDSRSPDKGKPAAAGLEQDFSKSELLPKTGVLQTAVEHAVPTVQGEEAGENTGKEDNPVYAAYAERKRARLERLKEVGLDWREGVDNPIGRDAAGPVIVMHSHGYTVPECCQALGVSLSAFYNAVGRDQVIREQLNTARADYAHRRVAMMQELITTEPDPIRARLIADCLRWEVSKVLPKVYGDKIDVTSAGEGVTFSIGIKRKPRVIDAESGEEVEE